VKHQRELIPSTVCRGAAGNYAARCRSGRPEIQGSSAGARSGDASWLSVRESRHRDRRAGHREWVLLLATFAALDERVGLYSCSCDAVIGDLAADRSLSMCGRGCTVTTDWSRDGQADLCGDRLARPPEPSEGPSAAGLLQVRLVRTREPVRVRAQTRVNRFLSSP
jgi:hypothetical protein